MKTLGSIRLFLFVLFLTTISARAGDALDHWYLRDARVVNKVRFVGGLFIGVGNNGLILTSTNGQTWTQRTSGTTANLRGVAFGQTPSLPPSNGSLYVVVGTAGTILTSSNAFDWTTVFTTNSFDLNDVAIGGGTIVATTTMLIPNQPNALVSNSGTSWAPKYFTNSTGIFTHSIISVGNIFVTAVGHGLGDHVWRSNGGNVWENRGLVSLAVRGIAYGNGRLIAVGYENDPTISTDLGLTWFKYSSNSCPLYGDCIYAQDITFGNSTFVAPHQTYGALGLLTTTNGAIWTKRSALNGINIGSLAFGNGTFIAAGTSGIYQSEPVSTPGLTIARQSSNALAITASGEVGRAYRLQTSTNLSNWFDHFHYTNTLPTMEFVETVTNNSPLFYRSVTP